MVRIAARVEVAVKEHAPPQPVRKVGVELPRPGSGPLPGGPGSSSGLNFRPVRSPRLIVRRRRESPGVADMGHPLEVPLAEPANRAGPDPDVVLLVPRLSRRQAGDHDPDLAGLRRRAAPLQAKLAGVGARAVPAREPCDRQGVPIERARMNRAFGLLATRHVRRTVPATVGRRLRLRSPSSHRHRPRRHCRKMSPTACSSRSAMRLWERATMRVLSLLR